MLHLSVDDHNNLAVCNNNGGYNNIEANVCVINKTMGHVNGSCDML